MKDCDPVFPSWAIQYLESFYSSVDSNTELSSHFITCQDLYCSVFHLFNQKVPKKKIIDCVNYLFENRVIRKSIISKDSETTIDTLCEKDSIYLTRKGSRLLSMLENDSVLLEVYREDIVRNYDLDKYYFSAYSLISDNRRYDLLYDLISIAEEVFINEDQYQIFATSPRKTIPFYPITFPITTKLICGIKCSIARAQNVSALHKSALNLRISVLQSRINVRIDELS